MWGVGFFVSGDGVTSGEQHASRGGHGTPEGLGNRSVTREALRSEGGALGREDGGGGALGVGVLLNLPIRSGESAGLGVRGSRLSPEAELGHHSICGSTRALDLAYVAGGHVHASRYLRSDEQAALPIDVSWP
ncbi:hypothetical protein TcWFU_006538 [Taenia crassiceps]|uniref:Uncharacterized protein n=1 Tax=Taenia crassiceps TaxID=6207 RepID=A0ABR4Q2Z1_9CEST